MKKFYLTITILFFVLLGFADNVGGYKNNVVHAKNNNVIFNPTSIKTFIDKVIKIDLLEAEQKTLKVKDITPYIYEENNILIKESDYITILFIGDNVNDIPSDIMEREIEIIAGAEDEVNTFTIIVK